MDLPPPQPPPFSVVYLDTETDFASNPRSPSTVQIGLHSTDLGIDVRLDNARGRWTGRDLWLRAFDILSISGGDGTKMVVLAHNGFHFDFMNAISELGVDLPPPPASDVIRFADSMEIIIRQYRLCNRKPPKSFSLDALYATFAKGACIPNRHDALEDARALRMIMEGSGIPIDQYSSPSQPLATWKDLMTMHRSWSVREGLLSNPSRPIPVPRVFPVQIYTEISSITLYKLPEEASYTGLLILSGGKVSHVLHGVVADRYKGLPGCMRAWSALLRSLGKRNTKSLQVQDLEFDHPLSQGPTRGDIVKDPTCVLPEEVTQLILVDNKGAQILERIQQQQSTVSNLFDASRELTLALERLAVQNIQCQWTTTTTTT
jgi:hypothetical protein